MKSIYYFLVGISLLAFGFSGVATSINARLGLVYKDNPSPKKQDKPQPKKHKEAKITSKVTHFSLLTGEITTTDALALPPSITANNSVAVQGGGNAVPGGQLNYTVVINNAGTDATGVVYTDVLNSNLTLVAGSVTATPIVLDDSYTAVGNVGIEVNAVSGLLANDVSPLNLAKTATVVANGTSTNGKYTIAADGSFTYTPNAGYTGNDSFTYTSNIGSVSATGTVNITVSGMIWFVNAATTTSGTGTLASPFKAISNITGTAAGHTIFVYSGTYTGSLTLLGTQKLVGQGAAASLATITGLTFTNAPTALPSTGGTNPTWNTAALTLGSGNDVQGISFNSTTGTTMTGSSVGALKVRDVSLNNTAGQALQITAGGALDVQFKSISAAGSAKGLSVNSSTGNFQVLGTGTTAGSGGTISNITTIGAEFRSVSNITLKNMNFSNANTASAASSATDYSLANGAITLNNVTGATFTKIAISGTTRERGITGKTISGFTLNGGSTLTDCGDDVNEGCLYLQELTGTCNISDATLSKGSENIARVFNSSGALTLNIGTDATTTTFNETQTQNANMGSPGTSSATGSYCFIYTTSGSSTATATLNVRNTSFLKAGTHGFKVISDGSGTVNANIKSCTFNNDNATIAPNDQGGSIEMTAFSTGNLNYNILNNSCRGKGISLINIVAQVNAIAQGRVNDNTVTHSGTNSAGDGIRFSAEQSSDITTEVLRNTVSGMAFGVGISATAVLGDGKMNATISNNTVTIANANASHNIAVFAGNANTTFSNTTCANVANNTTTRPDLVNGYNFRVSITNGGTHKIYLQGNGGTTNGVNGSELVWANNTNSPTGAVVAQRGTYGTDIFSSSNASPASLATCATVSNPTYNSIAQLSAEEIIENPTEESPAIEEVKTEDTDTKPSTESTNSGAKIAAPMAGETILVNGSGSGFSLPAGKSITIKYSATISSTPTACPIPDQGTVSGSNFTSVQTNLVNTNLTLSPINTVTASSAGICSGAGTSASAVCPAGTVTWYTAASGGSSVATGSPYNPANITTATSYYASCVVGTCESARTLVRSVTINANPTASPSSNTPICLGSTLNLTSTLATSYLWTGPDGFSGTTQNPSISNVSIVKGGTYTLSVTASGCTGTATTQVVINSTQAPTAPTATPSNFTVSGTTTLTASGCNSPSTITWYDSSNPTVALPNNTPTISANKTFFARCTGTNTCISSSSTNVSVTYNPCTPLGASPGNVGINWTGLVSTDWNNACNWNPAWVPDATNGAVVIDLKTNQPTISGTVPTVNLIYVNSNATLTVASGGTLNASSTAGVLTLQGGNLINDGTINVSGGGTSVGLSIGATASITNRGTITTNNLYGVALQFGNLTFTNESTGIFSGDFKANSNILTLTNRGTINYAGGTYVLSLGSAGSSVVNDGNISVTAGSGISNPSGSTITNNACGKILMTAGAYENGGTTTNAGLIQMPNLFDFTNTGTFTNNGVVKANTVSSITNNRMVITNACPIFTLAGSNNYTVSGIFTDLAATTSAGTYTSVGNKFTANNTIPTGSQTLYAQVIDGTCTFTVPFDFNNRKPTAVSVSNTAICTGGSVTLSATCASGTPTWYTTATGGSSIGTGASLVNSPTVTTNYYVACETTNCVSGRVTTNAVSIATLPTASASNNSPICEGTTLTLTGGAAGNTYLWAGPNSFTSIAQSPTIASVTSLATGTYTITVKNANNCTATATTAVTVNVVPTATASSNSPICVGTTLNLTGGGVGSGTPPAAYAWTSSTGFTSTAQSPTINNATVSATGTYTITVTGTGSCTSTATTAVTVNGLVTASTTPSTQTICSGGAITTIAITGTGTSYTWTRDNTTSATGIAANGSGDISGSLTNATDAPITVTFTITPVGTCNGTPITATVVVNPIPTVTASTASQTICSGSSITGITFNNPPAISVSGLQLQNPSSDNISNVTIPKETKGIVLNGFVAGTVFNWTRDNTATVTGIPASGSGNISGTLTNTTASPVTVTFTITPSYTNAGTTCTGTPITVTVIVNPNPASATITDAGTAFCSGSSTTLSAPADPNYTYAWERSLTGIASPNSFTTFGGTAQTQVITTSGVYRSVVTNQYNCSARDTTAVKFGDIVFSGSLATGDAQQTGRMNRFAVVSTCAAPKSYPGDFTTTGARFYDSYTVTNPTSAPLCATIGLTSGCGTTLFSAAYLGSFDPASVSTNYLADHGSSFPTTAFYEATIPANGTIVVVVHEVNPATGCSNYNLRIDVPGATVAPTASSNTPICAGNTLNLTGTGTGSYAWSGPNGFTSSAQNPSIPNATVSTTGTYTISVTNTNGCVFNATTAVTVDALPTATASSNSPICAGNTLNLTGGGVGTAYAWTSSNGYTSNVQSPTISNATVSASGTYTITVTNANGCTSTASVVLTVNAAPTATASSSTPTICAGNSISLTGGGVGTYAWTSSNGFTSTAQSPTISNATISATGTYTITVTNVNGCTSTASVAVTVNALPTATASTNTPSICAGTTISLIGGGVGTYAWSGPNGYTSSAQSPTIASPTVLASGIYRITVTNPNSCISTATTSVTVNPLPVVDAGANQTICEGSTASLTATCNLLTFNTTLSGTSEVPANASTATGNVSGTYDKVSKQLLLTFSFNGLAANATAAHIHKGAVGTNGPVQIPFTGVPAAVSGSFTYTGTLTSLQETDLLAGLYYANIHNASFPGGEIRGQISTACVANNFVWNPGNLSGQTVTVSPTLTQLYTVTASNTTTGCSTTATTTVNVNPRPVVTIGSNTPVCTGNTLNLTSGGGVSYAWAGPNTFTSTAQNPSIASVTLLATGTYTVTVTNASGCINTSITAVVINALPTATATNNSPICSGVTLNLTGGGVGTYAWTSSNGYTSTAQSPSIPSATISASGTYTITVTNANGCTGTATTSVTVNPVVSPPVPQANTQIIFGASIMLTATGCSGVNDVLKWYQSSDNSLAAMPVSPTVTTNFYAKCERMLNAITCISANSADVTVTVLTPTPPVATGATNCLGTPTTLTATGCSGSVGTFVLKWYQNADDVLATMPVSPTTTTDYYTKCEQTFNAVTAVSGKSNVVTLTILNPPTPVSMGGTIYNSQSITLTSTGCTGTLGTFTLKWYQTSDNALVTMPVSPTVTTQYYSKCEQTANSVTCLSAKSNDVTVTVVKRIFVDIAKNAAPIQNGNSWATAYGNLQTGLAAASLGSIPFEIWVAKGIYKPTITTDKTISFIIPSGAKVIGGFVGTEASLAERNFRTNASILSGEIGNLGIVEDNTTHVVRFSNANNQTLLDGFTIEGGYAAPVAQNPLNSKANTQPITNGTSSASNPPVLTASGGGILAENSLMSIMNCTITNNQATFGAGIYMGSGSNGVIKFCKLNNNAANFGGAIYHYQNNTLIENTLISGNKALGGAIFNHTSNPIINNVTIAGNKAFVDSDLGSIYNTPQAAIISNPVLSNCIIWGNSGPLQAVLNTINYSIVEGGFAGTANLNQSPKFVNPQPFGVAPIATGDYHIMAGSPATDTGDNGTISLTDLDLDGSLRRFNGGRVDRGAFEFQGVGGGIVISIRNGAWNDPNTWDVNRPPFPSDFVIIDQNHTVQITTPVDAKAVEYRNNAKLLFTNALSKLNLGF